MGSPSSVAPKPHSPYSPPKSNEPLNDAKSYFGLGGAYIRPDKHGDNIGNPQSRNRATVSTRTLALKERDKREAARDALKCTEVDNNKAAWPANTLEELRNSLKNSVSHGFETFNSDSYKTQDYHIIYDESTWVHQWKPGGFVSVALHRDDEESAKKSRGDRIDYDACLDRFESEKELQDKLLAYLRSPKKNMISVSALFLEQDTLKFLRQQAANDENLKFILVTWSPETVKAAMKAREAEERGARKVQADSDALQEISWISLPALAVYGAVGAVAWSLIKTCRGYIQHPNRD